MGGVFAEAWKFIGEAAVGANKAVSRQLEQMIGTEPAPCCRTGPAKPGRACSSQRLGVVAACATQVTGAKRGGAVPHRRCAVLDPQLLAIRELQKTFGAKDAVAVVQPSSVSFPGKTAKSLKALAVHEFVPPNGAKSGHLHAKAYVIQTAKAEYCVWGSANGSMGALAGRGNYEAVIVTKGKVGEGITVLGLAASLAKSQDYSAKSYWCHKVSQPSTVYASRCRSRSRRN